MAPGPRPVEQRFQRMLAMLPWLMARQEVAVAEVAERFAMRPDEVVRELEKLATCGLPPYQDELIDLWIEEGVIHVGVPRFFTRPVRPTTTEAFALLAAGQALLAVPGSDPGGSLASALAKVEAAMGGRVALQVDLEAPPALEDVQRALDGGRQVRLDYLSAWRDARTTRTVDPWSVFVERGHWYLRGHCHLAGAERRFRLDRAEAVAVLDSPVEVAGQPVEDPQAFVVPPGAPRVTLRLPPGASWVAETYPVEVVSTEADGTSVVRAPVAGARWLERLVMRVGPGVEVIDPPSSAGLPAEVAARLLTRYRT